MALRDSFVFQKNDRPTRLAVLAHPLKLDFVANLSIAPEIEEGFLHMNKAGFTPDPYYDKKVVLTKHQKRAIRAGWGKGPFGPPSVAAA